ncbi:Sec-independent protein translocase protein TatB [Herpetosiphon geysericola]|uniref:Sec-independent protein translocase protein TatB n=1 Tax=Herpetosiphon geysericola TaxID=70996 RepID=UPI0006C93776|nr:Sec-independent protein translocase protein TatB [Herpetosiphon geysericola]
MTIFGIGPFEFVIILVIALVVVGPERLPEMLFQIGQWISKGRKLINDLRNQARNELGDDYESVEKMARQLRDLDPRRQIQELGRSILSDDDRAMIVDLGLDPKTTAAANVIDPTPKPPMARPEIANQARMMLDDDLLDQPLDQALRASAAEEQTNG